MGVEVRRLFLRRVVGDGGLGGVPIRVGGVGMPGGGLVTERGSRFAMVVGVTF